jgi:hypothetical protein
MATMKTTRSDLRVDGTAPSVVRQGNGFEWDASPLRPIAHWVLMPASGGRSRLEMVWEVPDPISVIA